MSGDVAVLFWFYRDPTLCRNRLDVLRRANPGVPIYGVYGGDVAHAETFRAALGSRLDDFWVFDRPVPAKWKWLHGDLMLAAWYEARGKALTWRHVFVAQWDMLVLAPLAEILPPLGDDDVLLSGVLPVASIESTWVWSRGGHRDAYLAFVANVQRQLGAVDPMSCVFVVACLPRRLFDAYARLEDPEIGYVEYRLPTLAAASGLRLVDDPRFAAWRPADTSATPDRRARLLNGSRRPVLLPTVLRERVRAGGARVFHPYHGLYPIDARWAARAPGWALTSGVRAAATAIRARVSRAGVRARGPRGTRRGPS